MATERMSSGIIDLVESQVLGVGDGEIPTELWDNYVEEWGFQILRGLLKTWQVENRYGTYEILGVYKEAWEATKTLLKECDRDGGRALNLGCGPAVNELVDMFAITGVDYITAADKSKGMLRELEKRIVDKHPRIADKVGLTVLDAGYRWPAKMGRFDLVVSNTALCWMTPRAREVAMQEIGNRLEVGGNTVLQFRAKDWNEDVVRQHIPDELKKIGFKVIFAAIGAREGFTKKVDEMIERGEIDAVRPTEEEIVSLAESNGLDLVDRIPTFWPGDNRKDLGNLELGHGAALLFKKSFSK